MSKVKRLSQSYGRFISTPWRDDAAAAQRVVFCVYSENEERALRAKVDEFELSTRAAQHGWHLFDLTDTFAEWLAPQRYAPKYFDDPNLLKNRLPRFREDLAEKFKAFLQQQATSADDVVALMGVGSLFGIAKVKDVVDLFAPLVPGRLLVFFPGSFENNNYRLLDGYDGWNYLAVPITADKDF